MRCSDVKTCSNARLARIYVADLADLGRSRSAEESSTNPATFSVLQISLIYLSLLIRVEAHVVSDHSYAEKKRFPTRKGGEEICEICRELELVETAWDSSADLDLPKSAYLGGDLPEFPLVARAADLIKICTMPVPVR
jgi:hypothetical protein